MHTFLGSTCELHIFQKDKMKLLALVALVVAHSAALGSISTKPGRNGLNLSGLKDNNSLKHSTSLSAASSGVIEPAKKRGGEASLATSTFNLAKSIIGAGVLALPSGVAFFSDQPGALVPAGLLCTFMGVLAAYSFSLIGKACEQHNASSFQDAWAKSVDPSSAWLISAGITAKCFFASLAYSIIIGDSFTSLASTFNLPAQFAKRTNVILALTSLVLLPLCSLKSLNSLAPFSLLGLGGTLYTAIFMAIRYFDKSYSVGGQFFKTLAAAGQPSFNTRGPFTINHTIFILVSMLSTSFIAHYNAPQFYAELKDTSMPRFNKVVGSAYTTSILMFVFMMSLGFLTFGGATSGFVLNNYAKTDVLASFARLAIGLALLTGYPFTFSALREGILDLAKVKGEGRSKAATPLTWGLLSLVTALALVLKDVGFVVSLSGAMFGVALMFMVPAIMNICNTKNALPIGSALSGKGKLELALNYGMIGMGVVMSGVGVTISTLRQLGKL